MAFSVSGPGGGPKSSRTDPGNSDQEFGRDNLQPGSDAVDEPFRKSMADLSSHLSARFERDEPPDFDREEDAPPPTPHPLRSSLFRPGAIRPGLMRLGGLRAGALRPGKRAARPQPEIAPERVQARGRTVRLVLGFLLGATAAIAGLAAFHNVQRSPPPHAAATKPASPPADMAAVLPPPANLPHPPSATDITTTVPPASAGLDPQTRTTATPAAAEATAPDDATPPAAASARAASPAPAAPAPATPTRADAAAPGDARLQPFEIMEVQTRLRWLGFDPGLLDGVSGRLTAAAVKQYQASKGQPQTGTLTQGLLTELRQESLKPAKP